MRKKSDQEKTVETDNAEISDFKNLGLFMDD